MRQQTLFRGLEETFAQSKTALVYQDMSDQIYSQSMHIRDVMDEEEEAIKKQWTVLENQKESLNAEKKMVELDKEVKRNEH